MLLQINSATTVFDIVNYKFGVIKIDKTSV